MKWVFAVLGAMVVMSGMADDCLQYKKRPKIYINTPDWSKKVVQPIEPMDAQYGNVVATMVDKYDLLTDIKQVDGGWCVVLNTVDAMVGYSDFLVQIDVGHVENSCEYNAILKHEEKHIKTYLDVIDEHKAQLQKALFAAADAVMPVFVGMYDDIDLVVDVMNEKIQTHPELVLVNQKIKAAEEIQNKYVDRDETDDDLKKCAN